MANRLFRSQFLYSFFKQPVKLAGYVNFVAPVKASLVEQGVTLTAVQYGLGGNDITLEIENGATAGAEVITVTGNAILATIELGVSTITQVRTAINAEPTAAALVVATGTSATTVDNASGPTNLAGAVEAAASFYAPGVESIEQNGAGTFDITLQDKYNRLVGAKFQMQATSAVDLVPQIVSESVDNTKIVKVKLLAAAVATDPGANQKMFFELMLNNSNLA